jgi:hypothetical protein
MNDDVQGRRWSLGKPKFVGWRWRRLFLCFHGGDLDLLDLLSETRVRFVYVYVDAAVIWFVSLFKSEKMGSWELTSKLGLGAKAVLVDVETSSRGVVVGWRSVFHRWMVCVFWVGWRLL